MKRTGARTTPFIESGAKAATGPLDDGESFRLRPLQRAVMIYAVMAAGCLALERRATSPYPVGERLGPEVEIPAAPAGVES